MGNVAAMPACVPVSHPRPHPLPRGLPMLLLPLAARLRAVVPVALAAALIVPLSIGASLVPCAVASAQPSEVRMLRTPLAMREPRAERVRLGVVLAPGSRADTAGVRLDEVEPESPAAKAGLKAGDIITDINGTSLRVSREDAEDLALAGLAQRRLQRVLANATPGDELTLRVRSGSGSGSGSAALRTVTVKTVSPVERAGNGMVGLTIGSAGNARDTLGLFVSSVLAAGPADKAGIIEGERVAAINGVDVRIPREDIEDAQAVSARIDRFVREVRKAEPGTPVSLRVFSGGRYRDVMVTAARATALPSMGLRFNDQELRIDTNRLRESVEELRRGIETGVRNGMRGVEWQELPRSDGPVRSRRAIVTR
jgi:serine protease Do